MTIFGKLALWFLPLMLALLIFSFVKDIASSKHIEFVKEAKVINLVEQKTTSGSEGNISTEIRYLIVTDKETFVSENSILNGKYNSSEVFYSLKKDSIYSFKVSGYKRSLFFDYRNILDVVK